VLSSSRCFSTCTKQLGNHPGIAAVTLVDPPTTEAILRLTDNLLGILLAGRLDPQDAAWAYDIFVLLVMATAGSLFSPPTPRRWSPAMATSGFASPSTFYRRRRSPEQQSFPPGNGLESGGRFVRISSPGGRV
jgi:hypothetical protein